MNRADQINNGRAPWASLPDGLTALPQWVVTKIVPPNEPGGKARKIPINVKTGSGASSTNPATWATYAEAIEYVEEWKDFDHTHVDAKTGEEIVGRIALPGFVFSAGDCFVGIDIDHCFIGDKLTEEAQQIVDRFASYTERSLSGNGIHILVQGEKPDGIGSKRGNVECYDKARYFALTGATLNGYHRIEARQEELDAFLQRYLATKQPTDQCRPAPATHTSVDAGTVLNRAMNSKQADKLRTLLSGDNAGLPSDSDADLATCNILAFYCGNVDDGQAYSAIDKIIRESARMRDKWDTVHRPADGATYGRMTVEKALAGTIERYKTKAEFKEALTADAAELMQAAGLDTKAVVGMVYDGQKGCAELFAMLNKGRFCFDHTAGTWHVFQGHYWDHADVCQPIKEVDQVQAIFKRAEVELSADIIALSEQARVCDSTEESQKLLEKVKTAEANVKAASALVKNLNALAFRKQVVEFSAVGEQSLGVSGTGWDLHPWLLACVNGVVDLKTGKLSPGTPDQYIKAHCPTPYDPAATAPIYKMALSEIFDGNQELIDFFQRIIGMALVGAVYEHKLIVLEGRGRNGKDTLLSAICHTLGPRLAGAIQSEILLDQGRMRSSAGPSADIMRLQGLRLAFASETNEGAWMNAGKLKLLTGGGELVGRAPYARREVAFTPSHTLMLLTNSKPHAPADDFALWKRLVLIPFGLSFVENPEKPNERKADRNLVDNLKAEAPGVLNWMVEGCLEWQRIGLNPPAIVREATRAYQRDEDVLQQFVDEACVVDDYTIVGASALYSHYRTWALENGLKPISGTKFGRKMAERFQKEQMRTGTQYIGIGLPVTN